MTFGTLRCSIPFVRSANSVVEVRMITPSEESHALNPELPRDAARDAARDLPSDAALPAPAGVKEGSACMRAPSQVEHATIAANGNTTRERRRRRPGGILAERDATPSGIRKNANFHGATGGIVTTSITNAAAQRSFARGSMAWITVSYAAPPAGSGRPVSGSQPLSDRQVWLIWLTHSSWPMA